VVHRQQIAIDAVAHLSLGEYGFGCEDALVHLLNYYVWPNKRPQLDTVLAGRQLCGNNRNF
jgi:hypothetical protein